MRAEEVTVALPFPKGPPRTAGVHVSGIIKSLAADVGILDPKWIDDLSLVEVAGNGERWWNKLDEASKLRMGLGLAWEAWYVPQVPGVIHQPGEMEVDGIYMTHDGESLDTIMTERGERFTIAIHEVKLTYKSVNTVGIIGAPYKGIDPNWMWLTQTKSYCKARDTRLAYLHVLFVCGDYSYPISPVRRVFRIEYTQREIDESWEVLTRHLREVRGSAVGAGF